MFIECAAIILVLGLLIFMIARSGRHTAAIAILPLLMVPLCYLLGWPLSHLLDSVLHVGQMQIQIAITVVGLVIGCLLFGMLCGNYGTRRSRMGYLVMCGGFSTILCVVLIWNLMISM